MVQFPHDEFVKEYLPELIKEYGLAKSGETVSSERREIDLFFIPQKKVPTTPETLGLLGKMIQKTSLLEVFRKSVETHQIEECFSKLFSTRTSQRRAKRKAQPKLLAEELAFLWILTPTLSLNKLDYFGAQLQPESWGMGMYFLAAGLHTGIIVIHQLPVTRETLWLRILGRERVQENAIEELKNLPDNHPHKDNVLELVYNLLAMLESNKEQGNRLEPEDEQLIMKLSPIYLERLAQKEQQGIQQGINQGEQMMIESILINRFGSLDSQLQAIIPQLLKLSPMEITPLLLNLSRTELISRFSDC